MSGFEARMMVDNPDEVRVTMKITMSVGQWCELRDQLQSKFPSVHLSATINDLLMKIRKVEYPDLERPEPTP